MEGGHAPILRCMHGMALGFDEDAGARKYGGSTSRDVQISHRRRIERRISLDLRAPECLSDVRRKRTQYRKKMVVIIRWQCTMLAFTIDHSSKQGIA